MYVLISFLLALIVTAFGDGESEQFLLSEVDPAANRVGSTRIIGGAATTIEKYPYIVQVLYQSQMICAGSLLTRRHVLSAAHCFVNDSSGQVLSANLFRIRAGTTFLSSGGTSYNVQQIAVHGSYNVPLRDNDIALLLLSTIVTLTGIVGTATIPVPTAIIPDNATVTAIGWGRTSTSIPVLSEVLNEVNVSVVNQQVCAFRYSYLQSVSGDPYYITSNMICAGKLDVGGADACQGDSGGPLVYREVVVGVTSWGYGCAEPLFPGVYARLTQYSGWVNTTITNWNSAPPTRLLNLILLSLCLVSVYILY